jgi:DNA-binding MarR family transcriptional regulator
MPASKTRTRKKAAPHAVAKESFEQSPAFLLSALGNKLTLAAERTVRKRLGLALTEWRVLTVLASEPAAPPGRIIATVGVNKGPVSRAITALEAKGLVRRVGAPDHGLRTHLYLTPAGQAVHTRGERERHSAEAILLAGIAVPDYARLMELLRQLLDNADRLIA